MDTLREELDMDIGESRWLASMDCSVTPVYTEVLKPSVHASSTHRLNSYGICSKGTDSSSWLSF